MFITGLPLVEIIFIINSSTSFLSSCLLLKVINCLLGSLAKQILKSFKLKRWSFPVSQDSKGMM